MTYKKICIDVQNNIKNAVNNDLMNSVIDLVGFEARLVGRRSIDNQVWSPLIVDISASIQEKLKDYDFQK